MHHFHYRQRELFCEGLPLRVLAEQYGTPLYVYSRATMEQNFSRLQQAVAPFNGQICYAVKANSNLAILRLFHEWGAGFDIVSGGELRRIQQIGADPGKVVFAGVGKQDWEIRAALEAGIFCFNVESEAELRRIETLAKQLGRPAPVALRVNPDVEAHTHAKITTGTYQNKFGIPYEEVESLYRRYARSRWLQWRGVQMHIGSQITSTRPFVTAVKKMVSLVHHLQQRYGIEFFDIGGGIGIVYEEALESGETKWWETARGRRMLTPEKFGRALAPLLRPLSLRILLEPGRFLVGNAGVLVTQVLYRKQIGRKRFVIVDAAMTDLIRPMLYEAYHQIVPVRRVPGRKAERVDVVGPVCESGDCFASDRPLPVVKEGEFLAILSAGAYGMVMASNYNGRPMPAEVLVEGEAARLIRRRQTIEELMQWELDGKTL